MFAEFVIGDDLVYDDLEEESQFLTTGFLSLDLIKEPGEGVAPGGLETVELALHVDEAIICLLNHFVFFHLLAANIRGLLGAVLI